MSQSKIPKRLCTTSYGHQAIVGRQPVQCKCVWCNRALMSQEPCLSEPVKLYVEQHISRHSSKWKKHIDMLWKQGGLSPELEELKNKHGYLWLDAADGSKIRSLCEAKDRRQQMIKRMARNASKRKATED